MPTLYRPDWSISLYDIGDCSACLFSWLCIPCAIASSRSELDGSDCLFNFFCVPSVVTRWLVRTSYGIPGDGIEDCLVGTFCVCCSANQMLQTSRARGRPIAGAGKEYNLGSFSNGDRRSECGNRLYSAACMPCAVGSVLQDGIGMPWFMGCCCANVMTARNLLRYQYRIAGNDSCEECFLPLCLNSFTNASAAVCPYGGCVAYCFYVIVSMQLLREVHCRGYGADGYLQGGGVGPAGGIGGGGDGGRGRGGEVNPLDGFQPLIGPSAPPMPAPPISTVDLSSDGYSGSSSSARSESDYLGEAILISHAEPVPEVEERYQKQGSGRGEGGDVAPGGRYGTF